MSAAKNSDSVVNQGEFHSSRPGAEPLEKGGHKPGVLASEADKAPEFHAKTVPAGSAPSSNTFTPNPDLNNQKMYQDASSTIQGATSGDVNTGLGHPGQGQTSSELRDGRKGATGLTGLSSQTDKPAQNEKVAGKDPAFAHQRNLDDVPTGQRGNVGGPPAQEREPETAERVAAEN